MRAPFIVFEGLDGAGTTTQAHRLVSTLEIEGVRAHFTCEPSTGPVGTQLRQALSGRLRLPSGDRLTAETLALLFAADRCDHVAAEIDPLRASGVTIVCDRYAISSLAYQGQELDPAFVLAINARSPVPDLTLFLRVSPRTALQRRHGRHLADELYEKLATQERVAAAYEQSIAQLGDEHHVVVIDGERSLDEVAAACRDAVRTVAFPNASS